MDYFKPTLSLDADYYYIKSAETVYLKSNISVGLPAGVDCHFDAVNPDPSNPGNFIMQYRTSNNGTSNQDHTYTNAQDIPVIPNVIAQTETEVENKIKTELADIHKSCFTISCEVYEPDGEKGGEISCQSNKYIKVIIVN
jgi:hypothetical protein